VNERVARFLADSGFVVLTRNGEDPSPGLPFEAWAYAGPLDFNAATPVTFGLGSSCGDALKALEAQLEESRATGGHPAASLLLCPNVNRALLEQQAAILGKVVDGSSLSDEERTCLEGLWEFVHRVLDLLEDAGEAKHRSEKGGDAVV